MHCAPLIIFAVSFALRLDEETTRDMSPTNVIRPHAVSSTSLVAGGGLSAKTSCPDVMQFATDTPVSACVISPLKMFCSDIVQSATDTAVLERVKSSTKVFCSDVAQPVVDTAVSTCVVPSANVLRSDGMQSADDIPVTAGVCSSTNAPSVKMTWYMITTLMQSRYVAKWRYANLVDTVGRNVVFCKTQTVQYNNNKCCENVTCTK